MLIINYNGQVDKVYGKEAIESYLLRQIAEQHIHKALCTRTYIVL